MGEEWVESGSSERLKGTDGGCLTGLVGVGRDNDPVASGVDDVGELTGFGVIPIPLTVV